MRTVLLVCALAAALLACAGNAQERREREVSGVARRGDELLFVDDSVPGTVFRYAIAEPRGATRIEDDAVREERLGESGLAGDLEAIAVWDGDVLVLSEDLRLVVDLRGARYRYADRFAEIGNRGMEGLALRAGADGAVLAAALFEGGPLKLSELPPELEGALADAVLDPVLILHELPPPGSFRAQARDDGARVVPLRIGLLAGPQASDQRFRAADLVWHRFADGTDGVISLLGSGPVNRPGASKEYAHAWLQRFSLDGVPIGEPLDLRAMCRDLEREDLARANWEGLAWWEQGRTLVLVHDGNEGKGAERGTSFLFVDLPAEWTREPDVDAVERLHREALVFDGHNDLPWALRERGDLDLAVSQPALHTDLPRLRAGNVGAQFWSVYVPAETARTGDAAHQTLEQIERVHGLVRRYSDDLELAATADDVVRIHRAGRIASLLGIEGGYSIEGSLPLLSTYHRLGVRYMTLTHADTTEWADSATDEPRHGGLTAFGEEVVREMNRLGMLVDLSHVSVETMEDALRVSRAPVIFSHSSAHAIAEHARNVPDDVLRRVKENGGVVMINFFSGFVVPESARTMAAMFDVRRELRARHADDADYEAAVAAWQEQNPIEPGTLEDVLRHIDHVAEVAGIDHVGLGSDYDGVPVLPEGLEDVSAYPAITRGLVARGYSDEDVRKVLGENVLRVLRGAEKVARKLAREDRR